MEISDDAATSVYWGMNVDRLMLTHGLTRHQAELLCFHLAWTEIFSKKAGKEYTPYDEGLPS